MYSIKGVCECLGMEFVKPGADNSGYYVCPFCGSQKLNVNYEKNVWRCNKCNESGNPKTLVEKVMLVSRYDAFCFLDENRLYLETCEETPQQNTYANKIASENTLNKTYSTLLSILDLDKAHKKDLIKRGLTESAIKKLKIKSVLDEDSYWIPKKLIKLGCTLEGVPGFYKEENTWKINVYPGGYLIPFINFNEKITGFQIRNMKPTKKAGKYITISSTGKNNGTKSQLPVHLIGFNGQKSVLITEGALKADIATFLFYKKFHKKVAIMAIPGVNNTKYIPEVLEFLKSKGVTKIYDAIDMDKIGNEDVEKNIHVEKAMKKIKSIVLAHDLEFKTLIWNKEKGIDDFLLSKILSSKKRA